MSEKRIETEAINILKDLIRINTSNEKATEYQAVLYLTGILEQESIETETIYSPNGRANLVAKIRGTNLSNEPLVLLSHLDVVSPGKQDWTHPPFSGKEDSNCIWGRGTIDTKDLTAMHVSALLDIKRAKQPLNRDVYLVASADEENGSKEGMEFLAKTRPEIFLNATVLSEGGGFTVHLPGEQMHMLYSSGEKGTAVVKLIGKGDSGHAGSAPKNQAIKHLSNALKHLFQQEQHTSQYSILEKFKENFHHVLSNNSVLTPDSQLIEKLYEYMKYQTITVDYLNVGQRINVIPYKGEVILEFRTLPYETNHDLENNMNKIFRNSEVTWEIVSFQQGFESDMNDPIINLFKMNSPDCGFTGTWVPFTALGKTDGRFISTIAKNIYGLSPVTIPFKDVLKRVHNVDERIETDAFIYGVNVMRKVVRQYCM